MTYCVTLKDVRDMGRSGHDLRPCELQLRRPGRLGNRGTTEAMMAYFQEMCRIVQEINPQIFFVIHGGPFYDPESAAVIYRKSDAEGFVVASAVEHIPIEQAVAVACRGVKQHRLREKQLSGVQRLGNGSSLHPLPLPRADTMPAPEHMGEVRLCFKA